MGFLDFIIGTLEKPISALPTKVTGQGAWLKQYFDGSAMQIRNTYNGLLRYLDENVYTKAQTDSKITERVRQIGAGDMAKTVYDTNEDGIVDEAEHAATAETAATAATAAVAARAGNGVYVYKAELRADGWSGVSDPFTQTVACQPDDEGAPPVTATMRILAVKREQNQSADVTKREAAVLELVTKGFVQLGAGTVTVTCHEKPQGNAAVYLEVR